MPNIHINDIRNNNIEYDRYLIVFLLSQYIPKGTSYYLINHDKLSVLLDRIKSNSKYKKHAVMLKISHISHYYVALYIDGKDAWYNDSTGSPINDSIAKDLKHNKITVRDLKIDLVKFTIRSLNIYYDRHVVLERSTDESSTATGNEREKNKYTNTAVYSVYALKCLANHDDIETTQTAERLRHEHYVTTYTYWLKENRNITGIVKKGFIPKKQHLGKKIHKGIYKSGRYVYRSLSRKKTDNFELNRLLLTSNPGTVNETSFRIILKKGDVFDMNANVIVNNALINCEPISSWKGTSGVLRDRISHNKNDYKTLVYDWKKHWSNKPCKNEGVVRWVKNEQNAIHRFDSFEHPQYFLIHAGNPHPFFSESLHKSWLNPKFIFNTDLYKYYDMTCKLYVDIFNLIQVYNSTSTPTLLIRSVAIPPLGFGIYSRHVNNVTSNCLVAAINRFKDIVTGEFILYIPIHNSNDKHTKLFMKDFIERIHGIGAVDNND